MAKEEYFTLSRAAKYLGVSRNKITRSIMKGHIDETEGGRFRLISKKDVEELRKRYLFENFREALIAQTIYALRMTFNYAGDEKIEEHGLVEGELVFSVVVGNVQQEEIRIPIDEIRIAEFEDAGHLGVKLNEMQRVNVTEV